MTCILYFRYLPLCNIIELQHRWGMYWIRVATICYWWSSGSCKSIHYTCRWWPFSNWIEGCKLNCKWFICLTLTNSFTYWNNISFLWKAIPIIASNILKQFFSIKVYNSNNTNLYICISAIFIWSNKNKNNISFHSK